MWGLAERKTARFGKDFDISDLYDQLETLRDYFDEVSHRVGKSAAPTYGRARDMAAEAARDAEETMKDNLAISLVLALGLGVTIGYFLNRGRD